MKEGVIYRQAAIDALAEDMPQTYTPDGSHYADDDIFLAQEIYADCIQRLEDLPAAEPEIVRCKDCKHLFDGEHNANCCEVLMKKAKWLTEITVDMNWYCADGERRDDDCI